jgi:hypothetical protein
LAKFVKGSNALKRFEPSTRASVQVKALITNDKKASLARWSPFLICSEIYRWYIVERIEFDEGLPALRHKATAVPSKEIL